MRIVWLLSARPGRGPYVSMAGVCSSGAMKGKDSSPQMLPHGSRRVGGSLSLGGTGPHWITAGRVIAVTDVLRVAAGGRQALATATGSLRSGALAQPQAVRPAYPQVEQPRRPGRGGPGLELPVPPGPWPGTAGPQFLEETTQAASLSGTGRATGAPTRSKELKNNLNDAIESRADCESESESPDKKQTRSKSLVDTNTNLTDQPLRLAAQENPATGSA